VQRSYCFAKAAVNDRSYAARVMDRVNDETIAAKIESLVAEEHELRSREAADSDSNFRLESDRDRIQAIEVELDRCWDLLRQRRALRDAGADPEGAHVRDASTVEHYQQ